ncbi:hypothetical protein [Pseudorhodobacter sp.]|uniref:hypothetical protein n=1 Tax=Pseudorhodobacter sp. TaxID=1934400 RepID=UPI002AFFA365|nr:hypothetical protein [Pseudorhodobacter sp.]
MEVLVIVWVLCAGMSYFVARDRVPSKAGLATLLGFMFGPLGVLFTFLLNENPVAKGPEKGLEEVEVVVRELTLSLEQLTANLSAAKAKL